MPEPLRITGMPQAVPNTSGDIRFALVMEGGEPLICVAHSGVVEQIASGLGQTLRFHRMAMAHRSFEEVHPEPVAEIHVSKSVSDDDIIVVRLTLSLTIPFVFQVPVHKALELADLLKTTAQEPSHRGSA